MPHVKDRDERWALERLEAIVARDREDRDALPGSVVQLVKDAVRILRKRQQHKDERSRRNRREGRARQYNLKD
jgi:septum formation topological specificity factor MinE